MKKILPLLILGGLMAGAAGCTKFLEIVPKGQKVPQTFEDYKVLMNNQDMHYFDAGKQIMVSNDFYLYNSTASINLNSINYNWLEGQDRVTFTPTDDGYDNAYRGIFHCNVMINNAANATTGTAQQKAQLIAQARLTRAMFYFYLGTSYAKLYDPATAATDLSVQLNTSDDMEAKPKQVSVKELYDFLLAEGDAVLADLPQTGENPYFPGKGAGFAFLSRLHLFMQHYDKAEAFADSALKVNSFLFDHIKYYNDNKAIIAQPTPSINLPKYEFDNKENYVFHYGGSTTPLQGFYLSMVNSKDSVQFEKDDARRIVNYGPPRLFGTDYVLPYRRTDIPNIGGYRTPEMYYIKAECLARAGKYADAMSWVNKVRKTRILPASYTDLTADNLQDAIRIIRRDKKNEFRGTCLVYLDVRRFNNEAQFKATITKTEAGKEFSITPDSYLWILPFSQKAVNYGDGLVQNSK
ncbi:RagB/SusD family nutrient uptake outer membrane protein [Chitinophaga lutea]